MNRRGFLKGIVATAVVGAATRLSIPIEEVPEALPVYYDRADRFVPELWAERMIASFYPQSLMQEIQGIAHDDVVAIGERVSVSMNRYSVLTHVKTSA